ncbi:hypothetical protein ABPG75_004023 [Micractinium tetrahymenae]
MLTLSKVVNALEGLPATTRLISSSIAALQEAGDAPQSRNARVWPSRQESYRAWGQQVYRSSKYAPEPGRDRGGQHASVQQQRGQQRDGGGGGRGGGSRRDRQRQQQQQSSGKPMPPPRRQPGPGYDGYDGFRGNILDPQETRLEAEPYMRVAAKPSQKQQPMYPAYCYNISPAALRQDIAAFFDGYGLSEEEIRPEYSWRHFEVQRFWINFASRADRERALSRHMAYLGTRRLLMRAASPHEFSVGIYNPLAMSSRGRYVLVSNLVPTCTSEDVLRFFHGYDMHAKTISFLKSEPETPAPGRRVAAAATGNEVAIVRFASALEAHRAVRDRQGAFCGNNQVQLRVLQ